MPGLQDNMFNFNLENIEIPEYDKKMETQDIHKLGTIAQSLGLSGIEDNLDNAIQIESSLVIMAITDIIKRDIRFTWLNC